MKVVICGTAVSNLCLGVAISIQKCVDVGCLCIGWVRFSTLQHLHCPHLVSGGPQRSLVVPGNRSARCSDLAPARCSCHTSPPTPSIMERCCKHWPCGWCTLGLRHDAGMDAVERALQAARVMYSEAKATRFQLEFVEAAAMELVSKCPERASSSRDEVRRHVMEDMARPMSVWRKRPGSSVLVDEARSGVRGVPASLQWLAPPPAPPLSSSTLATVPKAASSAVPPPPPSAAMIGSGGVTGSSGAAASSPTQYKWQVMIGKGKRQKWSDCWPKLDTHLEAAYTSGMDSTTYDWDGWMYYYEFGDEMMQTSPAESGQERPIRRVLREEGA